MKNALIENIGKVHTTEMGVGRIKKNLGLGDIEKAVNDNETNGSRYTKRHIITTIR